MYIVFFLRTGRSDEALAHAKFFNLAQAVPTGEAFQRVISGRTQRWYIRGQQKTINDSTCPSPTLIGKCLLF